MKITVEVAPNTNDLKAVYCLMERLAAKEIERVVTGGYMSPVMLVITFEAFNQKFEMLEDSIYVEMDVQNHPKLKKYFSLNCLNGVELQSKEEFKDYLKKQTNIQPEIKYF